MTIILGDMTNLGLVPILAVFLVIPLMLWAGLLRIGTDVLNAIWKLFAGIRLFFRVAAKHATYVATKFAKIIRNLSKIIRNLYTKYVIEPVARVYRKAIGWLEKADEKITESLDKERLEDDES